MNRGSEAAGPVFWRAYSAGADAPQLRASFALLHAQSYSLTQRRAEGLELSPGETFTLVTCGRRVLCKHEVSSDRRALRRGIRAERRPGQMIYR